MLTITQLEDFTRDTLRGLRELSTSERDVFVEQIIRADPDLAPVLPELLAICARVRFARTLRPLIRDAVS